MRLTCYHSLAVWISSTASYCSSSTTSRTIPTAFSSPLLIKQQRSFTAVRTATTTALGTTLHHRGLSFASTSTTTRFMSSSSNTLSSSSSSPINDQDQEEGVVIRVALCQFPVTEDKTINHQTAKQYIAKAVQQGAQLVVLPEIWNSPYATAAFPDYAEPLPALPTRTTTITGGSSGGGGSSDDDDNEICDFSMETSPSAVLLQQAAQQHHIWLVGGSIPEVVVEDVVEEEEDDDEQEQVAGDNGNGNSNSGSHHQKKKKKKKKKQRLIYNTSLVFDPTGQLVAKHRKVHLFDIDVPGGITFFESDTLSPGNTVSYFTTPWGNVGLGICYDIRFAEYAMLLTQHYQCRILIYPGAFNLTTGPAHWELLQRARAMDNQCFVLTAAPARTVASDTSSSSKYPHYTSWGHSTAVSPWGDVLATLDEKPGTVLVDLDMNKLQEIRKSIPIIAQKRKDMYKLSRVE